MYYTLAAKVSTVPTVYNCCYILPSGWVVVLVVVAPDGGSVSADSIFN